MPELAWSPIPAARVRAWQQEGRSPLWQALVHRLHGADAVDHHGLSIADAERLVDAALDEIGRHDGRSAYPAEYGHPRVVLTEQEGGPPNERYPDPTATELARARGEEFRRVGHRFRNSGAGPPAEVRDRALRVVGQALLASWDADTIAIVDALAAAGLLAAEPTGEPEAVGGMQDLDHGGGLKVSGGSIFKEGHVTIRDEATGVHASVILTMDETTSLRDALTAYLQQDVEDVESGPMGGTS